MKRAPCPTWLALVLACAALGGACTVGDGKGSAQGTLYVKSCKPMKDPVDYGSLATPAPFDLHPDFFTGEPIEDIKMHGSDNRLIIRVQKAGQRVEDNDVLVFDLGSWRVAQCLRGNPTALATPELKRFCAWMPGKAWPRMRVGPDLPVKASLTLPKSCPGNNYVVATARDTSVTNAAATPDEWGSWIELREFGEAAVPAGAGRDDVDPTFKVEFGQPLVADKFHLDLIDDRVLQAEARGKLPPAPDMAAAIDGYFDFSLQRGQGAQTFP